MAFKSVMAQARGKEAEDLFWAFLKKRARHGSTPSRIENVTSHPDWLFKGVDFILHSGKGAQHYEVKHNGYFPETLSVPFEASRTYTQTPKPAWVRGWGWSSQADVIAYISPLHSTGWLVPLTALRWGIVQHLEEQPTEVDIRFYADIELGRTDALIYLPATYLAGAIEIIDLSEFQADGTAILLS